MAEDGKILARDFIESDKIVSELDAIDKRMGSIIEKMSALSKDSGSFSSQKEGNSILKRRVAVENELSTATKERSRIYKEQLRLQDRINRSNTGAVKNVAKLRLQNQLVNKEARDSAILVSKQVGAYRKLNLERTKSAKILRDMISGEKASNKEIAKAQANFNGLNKRVRKADSAIKDHTKNVGNYKSGLQGLVGVGKQLIGAFGIVEGLRLGIQFAKDAANMAREAKGVEFAFLNIGKTGQEAFEQIKESTRGTLSDLDIKKSIVEFDNFNLSLTEMGTLMEFATIRATQTGKSVEFMLNSLNEGLSKGSLRRLDNLGVSMIEMRENMDATGNSVVEAFSAIAGQEVIRAGNILDEAANSTLTWGAAWDNLTLSIGRTVAQTPLLSTLANGVNAITDAENALRVNREAGGSILDQLTIGLGKYTESGREANRQIIKEATERAVLTREILDQNEAYIKLHGSLAPLLKGQEQSTGFSLFSPEQVRQLADINEDLAILNKQLSEGEFSTRAQAKVIQDKIEGLEKERDAILGVTKAKKAQVSVIEGTIAAYERDIAKQKDFIRSQATTSSQIREATNEILILQRAIDDLNQIEEVRIKVSVEGLVDIDDIRKSLGPDTTKIEGIDYDGPLSDLERFQQAKINGEKKYGKLLRDEKMRQADIVRGVFAEFESMYGLDGQAFVALLDKKERGVEDFGLAAVELNNLLFNIQQENRAMDLSNARNTLDKTLNDETKSEEQKKVARAKFRKEEAKIKTKAFEADKKAALINIAIATAVGLIRLWEKPGFPAAIPLSFVVGGLGIAQAAVVASKKPPKFFLGKKESDNYEGWATWGEKGKEVSIQKDGSIEISPSTSTPRYVKASEIIEPNFDAFKRNLFNPDTETHKRIIKSGHGDRINFANKKDKTSDRLIKEVSAMRMEIAKLGGRPIRVDNRVVIEQEITGY